MYSNLDNFVHDDDYVIECRLTNSKTTRKRKHRDFISNKKKINKYDNNDWKYFLDEDYQSINYIPKSKNRRSKLSQDKINVFRSIERERHQKIRVRNRNKEIEKVLKFFPQELQDLIKNS